MIIVHLSNTPEFRTPDQHGYRSAHVRVVIHEPKERNRLDIPSADVKAEVLHLNDGDQSFYDWLSSNFVFRRRDPTPTYHLNKGHMVESNGTDPRTVELRIPPLPATPTMLLYDLGEFSFEGSDVVHPVLGFMIKNGQADFHNVDRQETVAYMLSTCRTLVEDRFLVHLHEQLTAKGFTTHYTPRE